MPKAEGLGVRVWIKYHFQYHPSGDAPEPVLWQTIVVPEDRFILPASENHLMDNIPPPAWFDQPATYQIIVKGRLDDHWTDWFDGLTITTEKDAAGSVFTILTGLVQDQGALHGLLARVRDLGLLLLEVHRLGIQPGSHQISTQKGG